MRERNGVKLPLRAASVCNWCLYMCAPVSPLFSLQPHNRAGSGGEGGGERGERGEGVPPGSSVLQAPSLGLWALGILPGVLSGSWDTLTHY